jgi:hypothetical protein
MSNSPSKIAALMFSLILPIFVTPILFYVINFERDNHNRTLINQLISGIMFTGILWNLTMQPIMSFRYIAGPIENRFLCSLDLILRNGICIHSLLLFDSVMIVRLIFIHFLKNPTAVRDDFWIVFINAWTAAFSAVSQTVFLLQPGKDPINYYMCMGKYPIEFQNQPFKVNYSFLVVCIFSIVLHLAAVVVKLKTKDIFEHKSLFSKTSNTIGIISVMCVAFIIPSLTNLKEHEELDKYPFYLLLYAHHLCSAELIMIVIGTAYFWKTPALRNHFYTDTSEIVKKLFSRETQITVMT